MDDERFETIGEIEKTIKHLRQLLIKAADLGIEVSLHSKEPLSGSSFTKARTAEIAASYQFFKSPSNPPPPTGSFS